MTDVRNREALAAANKQYEWGFSSDIEQEFAPKGLSEEVVRFISAKKGEPAWMLDWRLKAYARWLEMTAPDWAKLNVAPIDYQDAYYYAAPKEKPKLGSLDEVDPESCEFTRSWASRSKSRRCSRASRAAARWRWTRCSTACPSPPPSARNWSARASSSVRSARR